MNHPVSVILDGLSAAGEHWALVLGLLIVLFTSQTGLATLLYKLFKDSLTGEEYLTLGLAGWLLPACLLSLLWYLAARLISLPFSFLFIGFLMLACLIFSLRVKWTVNQSRGVFWSLLFLAAGSILLRLAFVSRAVVPSYFDSAQHYLYIREILAGVQAPGSGAASLPGYYHFGFHFLAALIASMTRAEIADTMLVLGQVILALMPFSAFFIVRHWTRSSAAGFLALTLGAFGWYMPAHAMDWGKYPALASLALVPFVLSLAYLFIENRPVLSKEKSVGLSLLLLAGVTISVVLHSRSLVLYLLLSLVWLITVLWNRMTKWPRLAVFGFFLLVLVGQIAYIRSQGLLGPLFDAYLSKGILTSSIVLVLAVFAGRYYPGFVFFCIAASTLLLASLFLPLGSLIPGYVDTTPLDRPYVQMILYLPLALLAGFGLSGLEQVLRGRALSLGNHQAAASHLIAGLLIGLAAIHGLFRYELYPSTCCLLVSRDDLSAIRWLDENLPDGAHILASSTNLNVLPTDQYQGSAGGDAGTWITPLTGRPVIFLPFGTDFSQSKTLETLCGQQVHFVYVGKTGWSFDDAPMNAQPDVYRLLLDLPKAKVYEVIGCK